MAIVGGGRISKLFDGKDGSQPEIIKTRALESGKNAASQTLSTLSRACNLCHKAGYILWRTKGEHGNLFQGGQRAG